MMLRNGKSCNQSVFQLDITGKSPIALAEQSVTEALFTVWLQVLQSKRFLISPVNRQSPWRNGHPGFI
jgi:hypothetical protein